MSGKITNFLLDQLTAWYIFISKLVDIIVFFILSDKKETFLSKNTSIMKRMNFSNQINNNLCFTAK